MLFTETILDFDTGVYADEIAEQSNFDHMHEDDIQRYALLDAEIKRLELFESDIDSDAMFELRLERDILKQFLRENCDA